MKARILRFLHFFNKPIFKRIGITFIVFILLFFTFEEEGKLKENPDIIVPMTLCDCPECGQDLRRVPLDELIRKQIEDIPLIKTEVTEYQIEVKTCPGCGVRCCNS